MIMMKYRVFCTLATLILFTSCELYEQDEYEEYYVIESYLVAGDELPIVRLSKTIPIDKTYNFQDAAVSDASVQIQLLNNDSTTVKTYSYQRIQNRPGTYLSTTGVTVQPQRLYRLRVTHEGKEITATTFVPGKFKSVNEDELQDRYIYQSSNQIEIRTTPSFYPDRQTYYIFTVNAIDATRDNLTPFYLDLVEEDTEIENFYINSSGIINEKNYEEDENGNITLQVPWLAIAFFGNNNVIVNAIDDNMYDFIRTQDVQTGGTTLSPGEIQNVKYNIDGGIGIFGSMASDTIRVEIVRNRE